MPDWQPNWSDVAFDHGAATTAVEECRAAARRVDSALTGLAGLPAADHWIGRFKDEWDEDQAPTRADLTGTAADLRALARAIEAAATAAGAEQSHRVAERERWWDEVRAENAEDPTPVPSGPGGPR